MMMSTRPIHKGNKKRQKKYSEILNNRRWVEQRSFVAPAAQPDVAVAVALAGLPIDLAPQVQHPLRNAAA